MATITEDYVSFETAKLLKEKGFDIPCMFLYFAKYNSYGDFRGNFNETKNSEINELSYSAPTLQMAMKWLREVHGLHIYTFRLGEKWHYEIQVFKEGYTYSKVGGDSHDEAVENAIWKCVNELI